MGPHGIPSLYLAAFGGGKLAIAGKASPGLGAQAFLVIDNSPFYCSMR